MLILTISITYHVDNVWFKFQSRLQADLDMVFFKGSSPVNYFSGSPTAAHPAERTSAKTGSNVTISSPVSKGVLPNDSLNL